MAALISVSNSQLTERNSSYTNMLFTVTLSEPAPSGGVSVAYRTLPGTAIENVDYNGEYSTLTIGAGATSGQISIAVYGDTVDETDESFQLELSNPKGAGFAGGVPNIRAQGIILDDDGLGSNLALVLSSPVVLEGASGSHAAHIEATLSRSSTTAITIPYQTVNGSAVAGQDYAATSGSITFLAGQTSAGLDVAILGDSVSEPTESFSVVFSPTADIASGANGAAGIVTILDDDAGNGALPSISIGTARLIEGNSSYNNMTFIVTLSAPAPSGGVSMSYRTLPGTATEDRDYNGEYSTLTIPAGSSSGLIQISVYGDTIDDVDQSFQVELSNPNGAVFSGGLPSLRAQGVILDDDGIGSNLGLVISNPVVLEGASGARVAHVEAMLTRPSSTALTIPYQTVNGTALAGQDYTAGTGSITFLPGQTIAAVDVPIIGDDLSEPTETFSVVFTPPAEIASGANGAAGIVTILDDDAGNGALPSISIGNAQRIEGNSSYNNMTFVVTLSAPAPSGGVSVGYHTVPGTATEGTDYSAVNSTLRIAAGATSGLISVAIYGDTAVETDESFALELTNPSGAVFAGNAPTIRANGFILDDDGGYTLAVSAINPTTLEGDTGTKAMHFEVLLSRSVSSPVVIPYQTINGTAVAGQDYVATAGSVSFLPGQTTASVDVPIIGNYAVEPSETFSLLLSASTAGPATAAISATGTIANDDNRVTVAGTPRNDNFVDGPQNQLFVGDAGHDVLTITEGRRGVVFLPNASGDVDFVHRTQVDTISSVEEIRFIDGRMVFDATDPAASVTRLYQAALGRLPDQDGLNFWIANLQHGARLADLATGFLSSGEFTTRFGTGLSNNDFVVRIYQNVLGRDPEAGGLAFWRGNLDSGAATRGDTLAGISESGENQAVTAPLVAAGIWDRSESAAQVARLYDTALGRLPDAGGLAFWRNAIDTGTGTLLNLADSFVTSAEFQGRYGPLGNRAFVEAVYGNTLGRPGDTPGVDFWSGQLDAGATRAAVVIGFSESTEHQTRTADNITSNDPSNYGIRFA